MQIEVLRVRPAQDAAALALAMQAWPLAERTAYEQSLHKLCESGHEQRVILVAARRSDELLAAQVAQVLAGRVALVWQPCAASPVAADRPSNAQALFAAVLPACAVAGAQVAQALTSADDAVAAALFESGGFSPATELLYLAAQPGKSTARNALPFELVAADDNARLAAIIDRTYVGTLDCPGLDGMRQTADVLAGYRAVGAFRPDLWFIVRDGPSDVGCLLLNPHPEVCHLEIVYLALTPEVRGRGWGLQLAQWARNRASSESVEHVVLAVDATNRPAIRLYEEAGFFQFDRRTVWLKDLSGISQLVSW